MNKPRMTLAVKILAVAFVIVAILVVLAMRPSEPRDRLDRMDALKKLTHAPPEDCAWPLLKPIIQNRQGSKASLERHEIDILIEASKKRVFGAPYDIESLDISNVTDFEPWDPEVACLRTRIDIVTFEFLNLTELFLESAKSLLQSGERVQALEHLETLDRFSRQLVRRYTSMEVLIGIMIRSGAVTTLIEDIARHPQAWDESLMQRVSQGPILTPMVTDLPRRLAWSRLMSDEILEFLFDRDGDLIVERWHSEMMGTFPTSLKGKIRSLSLLLHPSYEETKSLVDRTLEAVEHSNHGSFEDPALSLLRQEIREIPVARDVLGSFFTKVDFELQRNQNTHDGLRLAMDLARHHRQSGAWPENLPEEYADISIQYTTDGQGIRLWVSEHWVLADTMSESDGEEGG